MSFPDSLNESLPAGSYTLNVYDLAGNRRDFAFLVRSSSGDVTTSQDMTFVPLFSAGTINWVSTQIVTAGGGDSGIFYAKGASTVSFSYDGNVTKLSPPEGSEICLKT